QSASEFAYVSDLSRVARRAPGDESRSAPAHGPDRADARMRHRAAQQVRPEKLFLSGHAEELSDFAIRPASLRERQRAVTRPRLSEGRAEKYRDTGEGW